MEPVREATPGDVDAIAGLTAAARERLASWSPRWWRPGPQATELHRAWLAHLVADERSVVRVATDGGRVVGCAAAVRQRDRWAVDDVALARDDRWADVGVALLQAVAERPALTCVPTQHLARRAASEAAGLHHASSIWLRETTAAPVPPAAPLPAGTPVPPPPPHPFGAPLDPAAPGALAFATGEGAFVVGSPPIAAPPVYDPGGTVTVVDRVVGDPAALLEEALARAGGRGDVMLAVVAGVHDDRLRSGLRDLGFARTVDVFEWPADGRPART